MGRERQQKKNEEIKQAILYTALQISMEQGFDALSIRKITNTLGYSAGIVYHYYKDKQEIIDAIHDQAHQVMMNNIKSLLVIEKGFEYNTRVIFHRIMDLALNEPEKYALIAYDKYLRRKESTTIWISMLDDTIQEGIKMGELRPVDSRTAAINVWSSFFGLMIFLSSNKDITIETAEILFRNHLDLIMNGLKNN